MSDKKVVMLDMSDVTMLDMTASVLLQEMIAHIGRKNVAVIICGLHPRLMLQLRRTGLRRRRGVLEMKRDIGSGLTRAAVLVQEGLVGK
jgi:SulP family sulfate permease